MNVMAELEKIGAVFTNKHFVYVSGKHGSGYINMDPLFPETVLLFKLCKQLVEPFVGEFDTVVGPATGGIKLSILASLAAEKAGVWADKDGKGGFVFERQGFATQITGKRVLIVEDLLTTGSSVAKVAQEVEKAGGTVTGISVVCNRGNVKAEDIGAPRINALFKVDFTAQEADECELCANNIPIVENIGHGDEYKSEHPDYAGGYEKLQSA
jgi:orotate phosphoribosyltransferase